MIQEKYNIIGVMSGTSLDGIDLAHLNFEITNGKFCYISNEKLEEKINEQAVTFDSGE